MGLQVKPYHFSATDTLRLVQTEHYITGKGTVKRLCFFDRIVRPLLSWTGWVDTTVQTCARRSFTAISSSFNKLRASNPDLTATDLAARSTFVRSLVTDDLRPHLDALRTTSAKAHATVIDALSNQFNYDVQHRRPNLATRYAVSELALRAGNLRKAQTLFMLHEREGETGTPKRIYDFLVRAVAAQHPIAMFELGKWHEQGGSGVIQDIPYAHQLIRDSAQAGYEPAREYLPAFESRHTLPIFEADRLTSDEESDGGEGEATPVTGRTPAQELQLAVYNPEKAAAGALAPFQQLASAIIRLLPSRQPVEEMEIGLLRVEAEKGNAAAHLELAIRYRTGRDVEQSNEESLVHLKYATALGSDMAHRILCMAHDEEIEALAARSGAAASAAAAGPLAERVFSDETKATVLVMTGHFFLERSSPHFNTNLAASCLDRAEKLGSLDAIYARGLYFEYVAGDDERARREYEAAAQGGRSGWFGWIRPTQKRAPPPEAHYQVGLAALTKDIPDFRRARKQFELGAQAGHVGSLYQLADLYRHGKGGDKNPVRAEEILLEIERDHFEGAPAEALAEIGDLYRLEALTVTRDYVHAFELYEESRKRGGILGYVRQAEMFTNRAHHPFGKSKPEVDKATAFRLLKEAVQLEEIKKVEKRGYLTGGVASYAMGRAFEEGVITSHRKPDFLLARHYYFKAAREGNRDAWLRCMDMYAYESVGLGEVVRDEKVRRKKWEAIEDLIKLFDRKCRFPIYKLPKLFEEPGMRVQKVPFWFAS